MPFYHKEGKPADTFIHAEDYYASCLSLPMYPTLTQQQQEFVMQKVDSYYEQ